MKIWKIYKHTLIEDCAHKGWSYIGQTCQQNVNQRWRSGKGYKPTKTTWTALFWNAIQAHGGIEAWDINWTHEIIEDNITTLEEANERERYWIAFYHTWKYDGCCVGYNLTPGGDAVEGSRLMSKEDVTIKVSPQDIEVYLQNGWLFHDSIEYRPIKHKKWYAEHKAEQNARTKKYHAEHKEDTNLKNRENCKKYYKDLEFRKRKQAYRAMHRTEENERARLRAAERRNNPEYKKKHAEANKRWALRKKQSSL